MEVDFLSMRRHHHLATEDGEMASRGQSSLRGGSAACLALITALSLPAGCSSSSSKSSSSPSPSPPASSDMSALSDPQDVITALFQDIKAGRIDDAWARFGQRHRSMIPRERLAGLVDNLPVLRDHVDLEVRRVGSSGSPVPVHAKLTSASGEATKVSFYLGEEGHGWAIDAMHFDVRQDFPSANGAGLKARGGLCNSRREGARFEVGCGLSVYGFAHPPPGAQTRTSPEEPPLFCEGKLHVACEVTGPDGRKVEALSRSATEREAPDLEVTDPGECRDKGWTGVCDVAMSPDFPPGQYTLRTHVTDAVTGATAMQVLARWVYQ